MPQKKEAGKAKGKGKADDDTTGGASKLKAAQSINVRHILVRFTWRRPVAPR